MALSRPTLKLHTVPFPMLMDSWEEFPIICMKCLGELKSGECGVGGRNQVGFQVYFLAKAPSKSV